MAVSLAFLQVCLSFGPFASVIVALSAAAGPFSIDLGPAHILFPCTIIAIAAVAAAAVAVRIAGTAAESLAGREASLPSFACLQDSAHFRHSAEEQS